MTPRGRTRIKKRLAKKPAAPRGKSHAKRGTEAHVRWTGLAPLVDARGREMKRFFKLETLASATEHALRGRDRFILPSIPRSDGRCAAGQYRV